MITWNVEWKLTVMVTVKRVSLVGGTIGKIFGEMNNESLDFNLQGSKKSSTRLLWAGLFWYS